MAATESADKLSNLKSYLLRLKEETIETLANAYYAQQPLKAGIYAVYNEYTVHFRVIRKLTKLEALNSEKVPNELFHRAFLELD